MPDTSGLGNSTPINNVNNTQLISTGTFHAMLDVLQAMVSHQHTYTDTWSSNCNCNCNCNRGQI